MLIHHERQEGKVCAHHLILGKIKDYITGQEVVETHDEQARQEIARFLVEEKGYLKEDIEVRREILLNVDGHSATSKVDFLMRVNGKALAIVIFGPGSLVSRERSTVAAARLVEDFVVPFAVVTNGKDAEMIETKTGRVLAEGFGAIPTREEALKKMETLTFERLPEERLKKEERILYTFDVLAERECNQFTCSLR
jgi:hypothetical protein